MMIWSLCLSFVVAEVERQFRVFPDISYPAYDVDYSDIEVTDRTFLAYAASMGISLTENYELKTMNVNPTDAGEIVRIRDDGRGIACIVPPATHAANLPRSPPLPIADAEVSAQAREGLVAEVKNKSITVADKVWFWSVDFSEGVIQYLPRYQRLEPQFSAKNLVFRANVGRYDGLGEPPGMSSDTAEPVVADGKHMSRVDYNDGDTCGLTGDPRTASSFFQCNSGVRSDKVTIESIDEPYTCHYEVLVNAPSSCQFAVFRDLLVAPTKIMCAYEVNPSNKKSGDEEKSEEEEVPYISTQTEEKASVEEEEVPHVSTQTEEKASVEEEEVPHVSTQTEDKASFEKEEEVPHVSTQIEEKAPVDDASVHNES